jgi:hypothetical protein
VNFQHRAKFKDPHHERRQREQCQKDNPHDGTMGKAYPCFKSLKRFCLLRFRDCGSTKDREESCIGCWAESVDGRSTKEFAGIRWPRLEI